MSKREEDEAAGCGCLLLILLALCVCSTFWGCLAHERDKQREHEFKMEQLKQQQGK